jgi:ATP-dependent RNA helicase DDX10/DBP4
MLVLDEADRILDMGFQQAMNDIIGYLPPQRQTLLFSATQTRNLKELAKLSLRNPEYIAVHESNTTAVPNKLIQHYTIIAADQKINLLYSYIKTHLQMKSIVFLSSGKQVRFLYEIFRRIRPGVPLLHIHGVRMHTHSHSHAALHFPTRVVVMVMASKCCRPSFLVMIAR